MKIINNIDGILRYFVGIYGNYAIVTIVPTSLTISRPPHRRYIH